jgi:hypothetical protein
MTTKFWLSYLAISVVSVTAIGFTADCRHRTLYAWSLNTNDVSFTAAGLSNETLVISLEDPSPVECDATADYFAHGDGATLLLHEGFSAVECGGRRQKIDRRSDDDQDAGDSLG